MRQPLWRGTTGYDTLLDDLVGRTLQYSLEMKAASQQVLIRQTMIEEASSVFDWATFLESKWKDLNEPVGNTLVTGGPPRLLQDQMVTKGGVRRRNELGGEVEFSQQLGIEHSNSLFFVPPNQGQSRLALSYRQPLLRGAGRKYNRALIALASIDTQAARDQFLAELEQHLFDVSRAYWTLYQERALLLQKRRSVEQVAELLRILQKRQSLDVVTSQLVRAQAGYEQRRAAIVRADAAVRDSEARLRLLVNDPALPFGPSYELVPDESPYAIPARVDFHTAVATAIHNRPDLGRVMQEIKMGAVRVEMSQQELLPALELLLETYVMGLDGGDNVWGAVGGQFGDGAPSYTAGLVFEVPIGNRAARARLERRQFELGQLQSQMQFAIERVKVEVELSVREVETCWREMGAQFTVMRASRERLDYLQQRWLRLPGEEGTAGLVMDDLLAAQDVLVEAEAAFVRANGLQRRAGRFAANDRHLAARRRSRAGDRLPRQPASAGGPARAEVALAVHGAGTWAGRSTLGTSRRGIGQCRTAAAAIDARNRTAPVAVGPPGRPSPGFPPSRVTVASDSRSHGRMQYPCTRGSVAPRLRLPVRSPPATHRAVCAHRQRRPARGRPDGGALSRSQLPALFHGELHGGLETGLDEDGHREFASVFRFVFCRYRYGAARTGTERLAGRSGARRRCDAVQHAGLPAESSHAGGHRLGQRVLETRDVFLVDREHQLLVVLVAECHELPSDVSVRANQLFGMRREDLSRARGNDLQMSGFATLLFAAVREILMFRQLGFQGRQLLAIAERSQSAFRLRERQIQIKQLLLQLLIIQLDQQLSRLHTLAAHNMHTAHQPWGLRSQDCQRSIFHEGGSPLQPGCRQPDQQNCHYDRRDGQPDHTAPPMLSR